MRSTTKPQLLIGFLLMAISLTGCRKLVCDEFPDPEQIPVINALLVPGKSVELHASYTANINKTNFEYIGNANISLYVNEIPGGSMVYNDVGIYSSPANIMAGDICHCHIDIPGFDIISCADTVPPMPKVYYIEHINEAGRNEEGFSFPAIKISFANDTSQNQYYEVNIRLFQNNFESTAELEKITDPLIINEGLPMALFSNDLIEDTLYTLTINYTTGSYATSDGRGHTSLYPLIVEFRRVSHTYYQYARSVYLYENSRYPNALNASTTPYNTFSNISGAYGIFAGYSVFQSDTIYPNSY